MRIIKGFIGAAVGCALGTLLLELLFVGVNGALGVSLVFGAIWGLAPFLFVTLSDHYGASIVKNASFGALGSFLTYAGLIALSMIMSGDFSVENVPLLLSNLAGAVFIGALGGFCYRFLAGPRPDNY